MVPINEIDRLHWTFVNIKPAEKKIVYHDSYHTEGKNISFEILTFIEKEKTLFKADFHRDQWTIQHAYDSPKQVDKYR